MKRKIILLMLVLVVVFSATASAKPNDHRKDDQRYRNERHERNDRYERNNKHKKWDHPSYRSNSWHKTQHAALPFTWYEHRDRFYRPGHRIERIHDNRWSNRFPGLYAYRWQDIHGNGFWYQGRYVKDAVMFYNDSDELVSVGFMHNGAFLFIRDDDGGYENRDSFFLSWRW